MAVAEAKAGHLPLDSIRLDGDTQPRAEIDEGLVAEYAEAMEEAEFPPIVVFHDGVDYWLADGFHRYHAMRRIGLTGCRPDVRQGTRRDAILYSVGANAQHGKRRTNADKRKAVLVLLRDEEWSQWSYERLGTLAGVSPRTVSTIAKEVTPQVAESAGRTYTTRHGTVATMDTTNIGRRNEVEAGQPQAGPPPSPDNSAKWDGTVRVVSDAMRFAKMAVAQLQSIRPDDPQRNEALRYVSAWISVQSLDSEE